MRKTCSRYNKKKHNKTRKHNKKRRSVVINKNKKLGGESRADEAYRIYYETLSNVGELKKIINNIKENPNYTGIVNNIERDIKRFEENRPSLSNQDTDVDEYELNEVKDKYNNILKDLNDLKNLQKKLEDKSSLDNKSPWINV